MDETRKQHLAEFVAWARKHISGDEKGEAQIFLDRLFQAFGQGGIKEAGAVLEMRVKQEDNKGTAFADLVWKPIVLIEMRKSVGRAYMPEAFVARSSGLSPRYARAAGWKNEPGQEVEPLTCKYEARTWETPHKNLADWVDGRYDTEMTACTGGCGPQAAEPEVFDYGDN